MDPRETDPEASAFLYLQSVASKAANCVPFLGLRALGKRHCWNAYLFATVRSLDQSSMMANCLQGTSYVHILVSRRNFEGPVLSTCIDGHVEHRGTTDMTPLLTACYPSRLRLDSHSSCSLPCGYAAFVPQRELFFNFMTVREHLYFHAMARMSHTYKNDAVNRRVDEVGAPIASHEHGGGPLGIPLQVSLMFWDRLTRRSPASLDCR